MVEVRSFEGDPQQIAQFTTSVWRNSYQGKMPVPLWTAEFFDWELWTNGDESRDFMVAAYDGSKLVGFLAGRAQRFHCSKGSVLGTLGSYMSVHPDYARQGIAERLRLEQRQKHIERGADFQLGFVYLGAKVSKGGKFWLKRGAMVRKVGLWIRPLDYRAVADFEFAKRYSWTVRTLSLLQRSPEVVENSNDRAFQNDDLPDCLGLANQLTQSTDLGYLWDEASLLRQLDYRGCPRTVVWDVEGRVGGFVNYWRLGLLGRRELCAGVIDMAAFGSLSSPDRLKLLRAALVSMRDEGIQVAVMLRIPVFPTRTLLRAGFVPQPSEYYVLGHAMREDVSISRTSKILIHWR